MAMKQVSPPPRFLDEIEDDLHRIAPMPCKPSPFFPRPAIGTVIDENRSVKWNREEVAHQRAEYDQKVGELNTKKNKWRDSLEKELYERMVIELDGKITIKGASKIFAQAYECGHSTGIHEVFIYLRLFLSMFKYVLNDKED